MTTTIIESGPRHPDREHADRRARRPARPRAGLPDPRPGRPLSRARLRLPALPLGRGADRGGGGAALDPRRPHRARLRLPDRDARPRHPRRRQPARRRAVRPRRRGRLRALLPDDRRGGRRGGRRRRRAARRRRSRSASTSRSTPTCRPPTSPSRRRRSTSTGGSPPPASRASCGRSATSSATASARCRREAENLLALQRARIELGLAGAAQRRVPRRPAQRHRGRARLRAGRGARASRSRGRSTSGARRPRRCACPDEPEARLAAVLAMAEGLREARALRARKRICSPPRESEQGKEAHDWQGRGEAGKRRAGAAEAAAGPASGLLVFGVALRRPLRRRRDRPGPRRPEHPLRRDRRGRRSRRRRGALRQAPRLQGKRSPRTWATSPKPSSTAPSSRSSPASGLKKTPKPGDKQYDELKETTRRQPARNDLDPGPGGRRRHHGDRRGSRQKNSKKLKKQNFKTEAEFQEFLKTSHYTTQDVNERVKIQILSNKIQEQLGEGARRTEQVRNRGLLRRSEGDPVHDAPHRATSAS